MPEVGVVPCWGGLREGNVPRRGFARSVRVVVAEVVSVAPVPGGVPVVDLVVCCCACSILHAGVCVGGHGRVFRVSVYGSARESACAGYAVFLACPGRFGLWRWRDTSA
eukprot:264943-Prorocentrum_minimum.AAC.4